MIKGSRPAKGMKFYEIYYVTFALLKTGTFTTKVQTSRIFRGGISTSWVIGTVGSDSEQTRLQNPRNVPNCVLRKVKLRVHSTERGRKLAFLETGPICKVLKGHFPPVFWGQIWADWKHKKWKARSWLRGITDRLAINVPG